jgi:streptogramin lyase
MTRSSTQASKLNAVFALGLGAITALAAATPAAAQQTTIEYKVPTAMSQPAGIAAGPDGALWFTEFSANQIGRITTAGVVTEYAIPTPFSNPYGIVTVPFTGGDVDVRQPFDRPRGARDCRQARR